MLLTSYRVTPLPWRQQQTATMQFTSCLVVALIAVVLVQTASSQSNHAFWGTPGVNDTHVFSLNIQKNSRILQRVEETIVFPPPVRIFMSVK